MNFFRNDNFRISFRKVEDVTEIQFLGLLILIGL
jgi:hypothetical protein